jgi:hypothetical protein
MARSRGGEHRHRQPWNDVICPACGFTVKGRHTLPGHPDHIRAHFGPDGEVCNGSPARDLELRDEAS